VVDAGDASTLSIELFPEGCATEQPVQTEQLQHDQQGTVSQTANNICVAPCGRNFTADMTRSSDLL